MLPGPPNLKSLHACSSLGSRMTAWSTLGGLVEAVAAAGCLTSSCSSTRAGRGLPASCWLLHSPGPGGGPYMPTSLWGYKGGMAARNPSTCHVRSKLRFSLRAWTKPSFWGKSEGGGLGWVPRGGSVGTGAAREATTPRARGRAEHSRSQYSPSPGLPRAPDGLESALSTPPPQLIPKAGDGDGGLRVAGSSDSLPPQSHPMPGKKMWMDLR